MGEKRDARQAAFDKAVDYIARVLAANIQDRKWVEAQNGLFTPFPSDILQAREHVDCENRTIWFEADDDRAALLVMLAEHDRPCFDFAKAVVVSNFLRGRPLPPSLRDFAAALMLGLRKTPKMHPSYKNARRDIVISASVFEATRLFSLSENAACEAVVEASERHGHAMTLDAVRAIWKKSNVKRRPPPENEVSALIRAALVRRN